MKYLENAEMPDMIVTDIIMPYLSGLDVIRSVRKKYVEKYITILEKNLYLKPDFLKILN